jgi:hemerythrin
MERGRLDPRHAQSHLAAHRAFTAEIEAVTASGVPEPARLRGLVEYLVHWLAYHILEIDQSLARQLRAIEAGASPLDAFDHDAKAKTLSTQPLLTALSGLFQAVSERNRELRALNRELEARVAQRTAELEDANRRLQELATQDELTGLPNRRFAMLTLARLWEERSRYGGALSVLLLDADHFKPVNDRFGHAQGDALLRALAERLRNATRGSDVVCRLGGDEFLVICPRSDARQAAVAAARILAAQVPLSTPEGVECWNGSTSIGLAQATEAMARVDELVAAADRALYSAKRKGGGQFVVEEA